MKEPNPSLPTTNTRKEKIATNDSRWRALVEIKGAVENRQVFGLAWVITKQFGESFSKTADQATRTAVLEQEQSLLHELKTELVAKKDVEGQFVIKMFILKSLNKKVFDELTQLFPEALQIVDDKERINEAVVAEHIDEIPDDLFAEMLSEYVFEWFLEDKQLQEKLPVWRDQLIDQIRPQIDSGRIPLDPNTLATKIDQIKFYAGDSVRYSEWSDSEVLADYNLNSNTIVLPFRGVESEEKLFHAYTHEVLHALSGKTVVGPVGKDLDIKSALSFDSIRLGLKVLGRFSWLNEAITENLTVELSGKGSGIYVSQRVLLEVLLQKSGVSDQDFIDAYFEDFDPSKVGDNRIPAYKKLVKQINAKMGVGFLNRLDEFVKTKGVDEAVFQIMKDWPQI